MGAIWSRKPFHLGLDIHQAVADLGLAVKPHLTILDATRVLTSGGPSGPGDVASPGKMFVGRAIASVDALALGVTKFDGKQLQLTDARHIFLAGKHGLGEYNSALIRVRRVAA
jgi:uncharacterized protein (DUF362 family)